MKAVEEKDPYRRNMTGQAFAVPDKSATRRTVVFSSVMTVTVEVRNLALFLFCCLAVPCSCGLHLALITLFKARASKDLAWRIGKKSKKMGVTLSSDGALRIGDVHALAWRPDWVVEQRKPNKFALQCGDETRTFEGPPDVVAEALKAFNKLINDKFLLVAERERMAVKIAQLHQVIICWFVLRLLMCFGQLNVGSISMTQFTVDSFVPAPKTEEQPVFRVPEVRCWCCPVQF
jgi:hypothetical protein